MGHGDNFDESVINWDADFVITYKITYINVLEHDETYLANGLHYTIL